MSFLHGIPALVQNWNGLLVHSVVVYVYSISCFRLSHKEIHFDLHLIRCGIIFKWKCCFAALTLFGGYVVVG